MTYILLHHVYSHRIKIQTRIKNVCLPTVSCILLHFKMNSEVVNIGFHGLNEGKISRKHADQVFP
jgi:hypothetical protein